jgi:hypothetical protein
MRHVHEHRHRDVILRTSLILLALTLSACGGGGGNAPSAPAQYTVGGSVSGLASGATLTLANNSADTVSITSNGAFSLVKTLSAGSKYSVTVTTQPSAPVQTCTVANGTGTVGAAAITNIAVTCVISTFQVSAAVSGLVGSGLVLENNGTDDVAVSADGVVSFSKPIDSGAAYSVTVKTAPGAPVQNCSVNNSSGTVRGANITNVAVSCATSITQANAQSVAIVGSRSAETVLQLASFVGEKLSYLSAHLAAQVVESCADPSRTKLGTATYTFSDNDKNGVLSTGDTVTVAVDTCYSPSLSDYPTGTVTLTMSTPPAGNYARGFGARAQFASLALVDRTMNGTLDATYTDSETARVVSAHVATSTLTIVGASGGFFQQDTVTVHSADVSKTADYVAAQYNVMAAADISSQAQQGRFEISTPTPLTGPFMSYYGIYPTAGVEQIAGGATRLLLTAVNAPDNQLPQLALDDGTGNLAALTLGLPWNGPFTGFPWWEPHAGAVSPQSQPGYSYGTLSQWGMSLLYAIPQQDAVNGILGTDLPVNTPVKFFFSAPLDTTRSTFIYQPQYVAGAANIPATATSNGAITTITAPLQHGFAYQLPSMQLFSTSNILPGIFNYQTLSTSNNLVADAAPSPAVAAPGQAVTLRSSRSLSTNSTIAGYSWTQVSGTAVQLASATSASASYVVPAAAVNGEALVFQLTITDANGETDSVPVTAFVLTDLTQPFMYFRQQQTAAVGLTPEMATLESALNGTVATAQNQNAFDFGISTPVAPFVYDALQLLGPYNANLAVGTYQSTPTGNSIINDNKIGFTCNTPNQAFTVLDLSTGSNGTVNRFAADFNEVCPDGSHSYVGSVRVHSSLPLP